MDEEFPEWTPNEIKNFITNTRVSDLELREETEVPNGNGLFERANALPSSQSTSILSQIFSNSHTFSPGYSRGASLIPLSNINSFDINNNNVANSQFIDNVDNNYNNIIHNYTHQDTDESDNISFTSSISMESLLMASPPSNIRHRRYHTISTSSDEG